MTAINVVVLAAIGAENLKRIAAVSRRVRVLDASSMWDARDPVDRRKEEVPDPRFQAILAEAEVLYGYAPPADLASRAPKLKWFQTMLAGVDHILTRDVVESRLLLTNTRGIHATPVGEVALGMMLLCAKR